MRWPVISSGATARGSAIGTNPQATSDRLGREVNPTVYRAEELAEPSSFVRRVLDGPKIMLVGTEDGIANLAEKPVAHETPAQPRRGRRPARHR